MVDRIPSLLPIHVVHLLALCGFPTKPMVSSTSSQSWCIVPSVLHLTLCVNVQSCHWHADGKLWCNGVESREGGRDRTIIRIQIDLLCRM